MPRVPHRQRRLPLSGGRARRALSLIALAAASCGGAPGSAAGPRPDAAADAAPSLLAACLPMCIVALYRGCLPEGACVAETAGDVTACYGDGVRVRRERRPDGTVVTTSYTPGGTPCLRKTQMGNEIEYQRLPDGPTARVHAVSGDLHTAFCGDDAYSGAYPLPRCAALEDLDCGGGSCALP